MNGVRAGYCESAIAGGTCGNPKYLKYDYRIPMPPCTPCSYHSGEPGSPSEHPHCFTHCCCLHGSPEPGCSIAAPPQELDNSDPSHLEIKEGRVKQ